MSTDKGVKLDDNKPRLDLVLGDFSNALWEVGKVGTFGAKKYTDKGWQEVENGIERYSNALLRHYFKYKQGDEFDLESNLLHLSHLAWNALAILELYTRDKIEDVLMIHPRYVTEVPKDIAVEDFIEKINNTIKE